MSMLSGLGELLKDVWVVFVLNLKEMGKKMDAWRGGMGGKRAK
jgi:hypothetical protein